MTKGAMPKGTVGVATMTVSVWVTKRQGTDRVFKDLRKLFKRRLILIEITKFQALG